MYIYTVSISPNPLSFNVHFPVSIVAFQCHTLKLQDRIHLNIAVAGPTSTLAEETNHSVACGPICFPYVVHGNKKTQGSWATFGASTLSFSILGLKMPQSGFENRICKFVGVGNVWETNMAMITTY